MKIQVGDRVRVKQGAEPIHDVLLGITGTVEAPEDEGWGFDWKVKLDTYPQDLTSFRNDELEVI